MKEERVIPAYNPTSVWTQMHYIQNDKEFYCPAEVKEVGAKLQLLHPVDITYCESLCIGKGCRDLGVCGIYLEKKKLGEPVCTYKPFIIPKLMKNGSEVDTNANGKI